MPECELYDTTQSVMTGATFDAETEGRWFALRTRPRHEKKVNSQLNTKGVEAYLPLIAERRRWSDRYKVVEAPLFAGYVFARIPAVDQFRSLVLNTQGVCWFVGDRGKGSAIPDKQIKDIQTVLTGTAPFTHHPYIRVGQHVKIRGGCLDGVEGVLVSQDSERTVVVSVELLRRSLAVSINGYELEGL